MRIDGFGVRLRYDLRFWLALVLPATAFRFDARWGYPSGEFGCTYVLARIYPRRLLPLVFEKEPGSLSLPLVSGEIGGLVIMILYMMFRGLSMAIGVQMGPIGGYARMTYFDLWMEQIEV